GVMGHYLPSVIVPPIVARLRHETESLILPGEEEELQRYLAQRRRAGVRLNLNLLGEAILGEGEAARRLEAYLALMAREDVEYISVKVSSVFSQINLVAFRHTVERVKARLRVLYQHALRHHYRHPDGHLTPKFINLDMEEHRDLDLTVTAFREVLDEEEFVTLRAGVVLQAYLPESHRVQRALTAWAIERRRRGGAPIKLRIVKGANLAMERIEAAVHGWPQAPYTTKAEVDANFKRMIEYGCLPERAQAVHLGIASHNLFDVAHGLLLRAESEDESLSPIGGEGRTSSRDAVLSDEVSAELVRGQTSRQEQGEPAQEAFATEPDTDWSVPANREWIDAVVSSWRARPPETVPLQIAGDLIKGASEVEARDRSLPERIAYRHALADRAQIDRALDAARAAHPAWAARPPAERRALLKPAPEAVLVGWHLARALWDVGIPREVLQFVPCPDDDVGRALITDPRVDAVILTGSAETARRFLAWRPDLRLFAETSGKNAIIITALADRDQAI